MRSDVHGAVPAGPSGGGVPPSKPPKYSELYETGSTSNGSNLGTPPRYTSKPSSSAEASQENVAKSSAGICSSTTSLKSDRGLI